MRWRLRFRGTPCQLVGAVVLHVCNCLGITHPQQIADITNRLFDDTAIGWHDPSEALYIAEDIFERAA